MKNLFIIFLFAAISICSFTQDIIITRDSTRIDAKILEVSKSEIKYKEFDFQDGPIFTLSTEDIATVTFRNGKVLVYHRPKSRKTMERERIQREVSARPITEREQKDLGELGQVREEEERTRQAAAIARAKQLKSLFESSENATNAGQKGGSAMCGSTDGNVWSLDGRSVIGTLPRPSSDFKQEGKVVVQILVNATGDVVSAKCAEGTTITDEYTKSLALRAAYKTKFTRGDVSQLGTITYHFKIK